MMCVTHGDNFNYTICLNQLLLGRFSINLLNIWFQAFRLKCIRWIKSTCRISSMAMHLHIFTKVCICHKYDSSIKPKPYLLLACLSHSTRPKMNLPFLWHSLVGIGMSSHAWHRGIIRPSRRSIKAHENLPLNIVGTEIAYLLHEITTKAFRITCYGERIYYSQMSCFPWLLNISLFNELHILTLLYGVYTFAVQTFFHWIDKRNAYHNNTGMSSNYFNFNFCRFFCLKKVLNESPNNSSNNVFSSRWW